MKKGIFIAGTGTDIGKTYVTALLIEQLKLAGLNAGYYKAAISGGLGDAEYICQKAKLNISPRELISYVYETPVSPHLAATIENNQITIEKIVHDFQVVKENFHVITVEGAGGLICPLKVSDSEIIMQTDIIKTLQLDIILCVSSGLGTINSTVLTTSYAQQNNLTIKGIIMNHFEKENFLHEDNKKMIEKLTGIPIIACVPANSEKLMIENEELLKLYGDV